MAQLRILHVSDLHFGPQSGSRPRLLGLRKTLPSHDAGAANALVRFVQKNTSQIDVIAITGDLAHSGHYQSVDAAREFVDAPYGNRRKRGEVALSKATDKPIVLLPGNHDRFGYLFAPGATYFDREFRSYWKFHQSAGQLWPKPDEQTPGADFVLIGADFSLHPIPFATVTPVSPARRLGRGLVDPACLASLISATDQARNQHPETTIIWLVHFEPYSQNLLLKLEREKEFLAAVEDHRIDLILCGHTHRSSLRKIGRAICSVCGTTSEFEPPDGNHLHYLELASGENGLRGRLRVYRYLETEPQKGFTRIADFRWK